jgi:hypothetical protein
VDETLAHVKEKDELDLRRAVKNEPIDLVCWHGCSAGLSTNPAREIQLFKGQPVATHDKASLIKVFMRPG